MSENIITMPTFLIRWFYKLSKKSPADMPMVKYWKTKESVEAKVVKTREGGYTMHMEGEKYPFPTYPRGYLLFGPLSKLKHEIKNQVFNESWKMLEDGVDEKTVVAHIKSVLFGEVESIAEELKYEMLPPASMCPSVREIHRAWTKVSPETAKLRDYLCFILQEDDAYRFRVQWLATWFGWLMKLNPVKWFEYALQKTEHAEVVGDMKERIRLLRRILLVALQDPKIRDLFTKLFREINWKKVRLSEADKYHFRGKYFKVDMDVLEY